MGQNDWAIYYGLICLPKRDVAAIFLFGEHVCATSRMQASTPATPNQQKMKVEMDEVCVVDLNEAKGLILQV